MSVTLDGIVLEFDKVHTVSDSVPMYSVVNALHPWNAPFPMLVTDGNDTLVNALQE